MPVRSSAAQSGVTLIEACAVCAIAAVLAANAVPSFDDALQRRRLEGHAAELSTAIHLARSEAVARNRTLRLTFTRDAGGTCYLLHTGNESDCRCDEQHSAQCEPGHVAIKSGFVPASNRVLVDARTASMIFDPVRGTATPANTVSLVDGKGRELRHVVSIMGRVRTCTPDGVVAGYKPC
jgi:type IV fimbrial biogenesis protein FimT